MYTIGSLWRARSALRGLKPEKVEDYKNELRRYAESAFRDVGNEIVSWTYEGENELICCTLKKKEMAAV